MKDIHFLDQIYSNHNLESAPLRRDPLNISMKKLHDAGKDCSSCSGLCCSYAHNSMLITPLEALELYTYLRRKGRVTSELIQRLKDSVLEFRLDKELFIGSGREFRRNYTCPFFNEGVFGCSVSPKHKPYGCLGFNPTTEKVSSAGSCKVYEEVHDQREALYRQREDLANSEISEKLNLYWKKKNIPSALLDLIERIK